MLYFFGIDEGIPNFGFRGTDFQRNLASDVGHGCCQFEIVENYGFAFESFIDKYPLVLTASEIL